MYIYIYIYIYMCVCVCVCVCVCEKRRWGNKVRHLHNKYLTSFYLASPFTRISTESIIE
ncbi:hypothetical protein BDV35DRAFT_76331 [Aspergillus flavus]|uniref:Uncharacterized protein n=1 Tax=Aspergillus flavus TaxID=5059 RepID=A0A5N6GL94_ASPFL|nr:hypothetical protein BDV35DRAFT_76331 [Aspergillus flavus]